MVSIKDVSENKVSLDLESVDRVYLNGYVKDLQMGGGLVKFIRNIMNWPIPSPKAMGIKTQEYNKAVEAYAKEIGQSILRFEKGKTKMPWPVYACKSLSMRAV